MCTLLFIDHYMRPKGHGSGLPLPIGQRRLFTYKHSLAQITITDHSRAPPSPSPLTRPFTHGLRRKLRQPSMLYSAVPSVSTPGGRFPRPWASSPPCMTPLQLKCPPSSSATPSPPILRDSPPLETTSTLLRPLLPHSLFAWAWRFFVKLRFSLGLFSGFYFSGFWFLVFSSSVLFRVYLL